MRERSRGATGDGAVPKGTFAKGDGGQNVREGMFAKGDGGQNVREGMFAKGDGGQNVRKGMFAKGDGGQNIREGTFARGDLQGHRSNVIGCWQIPRRKAINLMKPRNQPKVTRPFFPRERAGSGHETTSPPLLFL